MEIFGFGQRVDIDNNMYVNNTVTVFNSKGNEKFIIKIWNFEIDKYIKLNDLIKSIMKEFGKDPSFWSILSEKLNNEFSIINYDKPQKEQTKQNKKATKTEKETFQQIQMSADYAEIKYKGDIVEIVFANKTEINTVTFKYRKSWSHRKYIDQAILKTGITPSWEFKYGWEMAS